MFRDIISAEGGAMLRIVICAFALLATVASGSESHGRTVPYELAGIVVGDLLENHRERIREETSIPIRFFETLKEVETLPQFGYKTGLVTYGTCVQPPRIIRLKFKYADSSREFYDKLLVRFKQRFGKPDKWLGDPFGIVIVWKWSFIDEKGNDISLTLQHNIKDEEEKQGNAVKLTMWNLMREESRCFDLRTEKLQPDQGSTTDPRKGQPIDWDRFVPR